MAVEVAQSFIKNAHFVVVGASSNRQKFGNRILRWYQSNDLPVTPINPKESTIEGLETLKSIEEVADPAHTSLSIITPPSVTLNVLRDAKRLGFKSIWIQPGAEDKSVVDFINEEKDLEVIHSGPCLLVKGPILLTKSRI
ncbi:CoA-binding protein [Sporodiniella umbellata]|nr:CoA-binding protein [Sporodiniella umbellata]